MNPCDLDALYLRLPGEIGALLRALDRRARLGLEEIRIYAGRNTEIVVAGTVREIPVRIRMDDLLAALSEHALYRCEQTMTMGYIPLPGGHRAGVCGRMICQPGGTWQMAQVSSVCIRIGRYVPDASLLIRPYLLDGQGHAQRVLVLGAPGSGKTTVLRDAALWLSERDVRVAVADEREELFSGDLTGIRLDVLSGMEKARALPMLIRTMAPQMLVTDEIGREEDVQAVLDALRCGVGLLASVHAHGLEDAVRRPAIRALFEHRAFDWYALLGWRSQVNAVYRDTGNGWEETVLDQLGHGRDDNDCHQRGGLFAL